MSATVCLPSGSTLTTQKFITLLTPTVQTDLLRVHQPETSQAGDELWPEGNPNVGGQNEGGLIWNASVGLPEHHATGQWAFLNVATSITESWTFPGGRTGTTPYRPGLHTDFPYVQGENRRRNFGIRGRWGRDTVSK